MSAHPAACFRRSPVAHPRLSGSILAVAIAVMLCAAAAPGAEARPTRIVAVGDFGVRGDAQLRIGESIRRFVERRGSALLVTLGDDDYTPGVDFESNWDASFDWLTGERVAVAGTIGNHD